MQHAFAPVEFENDLKNTSLTDTELAEKHNVTLLQVHRWKNPNIADEIDQPKRDRKKFERVKDEFLVSVESGLTNVELSKKYEVCTLTIINWKKRLGKETGKTLIRDTHWQAPTAVPEDFFENLKSGHTLAKLAEHYGKCVSTIINWKRMLNDEQRSQLPAHRYHSRSIPEDFKENMSFGVTKRALAKKYDTSIVTINKWIESITKSE